VAEAITHARWSGSDAIDRLPAISTTVPITSVVRAPKRCDSRADTGEKTAIAAPIGSSANPATTSGSPNPYPVSTGACSTCVVTRKPVNMANPMRMEPMFVHSTAGCAETRRSTSGDVTRSSMRPTLARPRAASARP